MPFYIRKSISLGPVRFNLSKSGLGVSLGVKGLRVGTGPRGKYLHMGRGGLYYRTSLEGKPADATEQNEAGQLEQSGPEMGGPETGGAGAPARQSGAGRAAGSAWQRWWPFVVLAALMAYGYFKR